MKSSKCGICCDECFASIARRNTTSARLWLDLCETLVKLKVAALVMSEHIDLSILEDLGFITTTEVPDMPDEILVKLMGKSNDLDGHFFCKGDCFGR